MPVGLAGGIARRSRSFGLLRKKAGSSAPIPPAGQHITENFSGLAAALAGQTTTTGNKVWTSGTGTGVFSKDGAGLGYRSDGTGDARVWVDADQTTNFQKVAVDVSADIQSGIFGRAKDKDHYWIFYNNGDFTGLAYQVGGGFVFIRQQSDTTITLPTTMTLMIAGSHINGWQNNQLVFVEEMDTGANPMYTTYNNGTLAGLFSEKTTSKFDNFAVDDETLVKQVFFIGDSLTFADNLPQQHGSSVNGFPWQAANSIGPSIYYHNLGVNGATLADMDTVQRPIAVARYRSTFAKNIAVVEGGINDLIAGASAATIQGRLTTIWGNLEAAGIKVVPYTITPFGDGSTETNRQTVNTWIRVNAPHGVVADVGANGTGLGTAGDQNNATNYQADKIHYTVAGAAIAAAIVKTAILAV